MVINEIFYFFVKSRQVYPKTKSFTSLFAFHVIAKFIWQIQKKNK